MIFVVVLGMGLIATELYVLSPEVRAGSVGTLERTKSWDTLVGMLEDDSLEVRSATSEALIRHGVDATPALARGLDRLNAQGRGLSAWTLGQIGPDAREAVPVLKHHMVADDADEVREATAKAVGRVGRDDPTIVSDLLRLLDAGDDAGKLAATRAVGGLAEADRRRAVQSMIPLLKHPIPKVREEAAEAFGDLGADAGPAVPALLDCLKDSDPKVRREAQEALEHYLYGSGVSDPDLAARIKAAIATPSGLPRQP
ncbi:MAG: HEAT repeat domain-containing protein [Gemmataceae bacterium]